MVILIKYHHHHHPQQQQPSNQTENNIGNPLANIPIIGKLFGGK